MSYHIYTTRALVLSYVPVGESDRIYSVFTKDLGLVRASARAVRKEESKLRGLLEPYSLLNISLVRGKGGWRLTSGELLKKIIPSTLLARPLELLERLVQGEMTQPELFDTVENALNVVTQDEDLFEVRLVAEILYHLGYLKEEDLALDKRELVRAINHGIETSGLI